MRVSAQHASLGEIELLSSPMKLRGTPPQVSRAPPLLGEHTDEVLSQLLNYSQEQIQQLRSDRVI
jgi:formyl-CoA transferase